MQNILVQSYALMQKLQFYHWNVSGKNFLSHHKMMEDNYNDLLQIIDVLAERIVFENGNVKLDFAYYHDKSLLSENSYSNADDMFLDLILSYKLVIKETNNLLKQTITTVSEDLLVSLLTILEKHLWMLNKTTS